MAAAPRSCDVAKLDVVSPELVLVDPELAIPARTSLPASERQSAQHELKPAAAAPVKPLAMSLHRGAFSDDARATAEARQRLMDGAVVSEVLGALAQVNHFRRRATLIPSSSAASSVGILVLQLYLGHGHLA